MSSPPTLIPIKFHRPPSHPSQASSSSSSSSTLRGIPHSGLGERSLKRLLDESSRSIVLGDSMKLGTRSKLTTRLNEGVEGGGDAVMGGEGLVHVELPIVSRSTQVPAEKSKRRKSQAIMSPSLVSNSRSISPQSTTSTKRHQRNGINWSLILSGCTPTALMQSKGWKGEGNHRSDVEWVSKDVRRERERERLELAMEARATTSKQVAKQPHVKRGRQPGHSGKGRRSVQSSPSSVPPPSRGRSGNGNGHGLAIAVGGVATPRMGLRSPRSPASSRESSPAVALASVAHHAVEAEAGGAHVARTKSGTNVLVGGRDGVLPPPSPLRASAVPRFASGMGVEDGDEGRRRKRSRSADGDEEERDLKRTESVDIPSTRGSRSPEKKVGLLTISERKEIGRSNSHPIIKPLDDSEALPSTIPMRRTLSHDGVPSSAPSVSSRAGSVGLLEHPSMGMVRSGSGRSRRETTMPRALKDYDTKITA